MLRLECVGEEATVQIEDVDNYLTSMAELMTGCQAVMGQIARDVDVEYDVLMDMFLYCMQREQEVRPIPIQ